MTQIRPVLKGFRVAPEVEEVIQIALGQGDKDIRKIAREMGVGVSKCWEFKWLEATNVASPTNRHNKSPGRRKGTRRQTT